MLGLAAAYSAIRFLSDAVASLPIRVYRRLPDGSTQRVLSSMLLGDEVSGGGPQIAGTMYEWLFEGTASALIHGNAWGLITNRSGIPGADGLGLPTGVAWLPAERVSVQDDEQQPENPLRARIYYNGRLADRANLVQLKAFGVPGRVEGISPLRNHAMLWFQGREALKYSSDWFQNGGFPPGTFQNVSDEVNESQSNEIRRRLTDAIRLRQPLVYGSDWDYKPITVPQDEATFITAMQLNATQVAAIYGVRAQRVGGTRNDGMAYCADTETEILTTRGWLRYSDVTTDDSALTLNTKTGLAEWQPVEAVNVFGGPHDVIRMEHRAHSSVTTPNHRWPIWVTRSADGYERGESHSSAVLTEKIAAEIRNRYAVHGSCKPGPKPAGSTRLSQMDLAREYGVSVQTVNDVLRGRHYTGESANSHREWRPQWQWRTTETLPSDAKIAAAVPVRLPTEAKWSDALVELMAWFWTEGHIAPYGNVTITQSQTANPAHVARIRAALTELLGPDARLTGRSLLGSNGWQKRAVVRAEMARDPSRSNAAIARACGADGHTVKLVRDGKVDGPGWTEDVSDRQISHFRLNAQAGALLTEHAPGKVVSPDWLTTLTRAQLELFVQTSIDGDGNWKTKATRDGVVGATICQKDKARLDAFQIACALIGKSGTLKQAKSGMWQFVMWAGNPWRGITQARVTREQADTVWCPTTANHTWFARRNGTTYFTGNSNQTEDQLDELQNTLRPWLKRWEDLLTGMLPSTQFAKFHTDSFLKMDPKTRTGVQQIQRSIGTRTVNEIRAEDDLLPLSTGDDSLPLQIEERMMATTRSIPKAFMPDIILEADRIADLLVALQKKGLTAPIAEDTQPIGKTGAGYLGGLLTQVRSNPAALDAIEALMRGGATEPVIRQYLEGVIEDQKAMGHSDALAITAGSPAGAFGNPGMRASDTDRERAKGMIRHHLKAGRLRPAEAEERIRKAAEAVRCGDLDTLFADLPVAEQAAPAAEEDRSGGPKGPMFGPAAIALLQQRAMQFDSAAPAALNGKAH